MNKSRNKRQAKAIAKETKTEKRVCRKYAWTPEQSERLRQITESRRVQCFRERKPHKYWQSISNELNKGNASDEMHRSARQCREHWICKLDPALNNGAFSPAEDSKLLKCVRLCGFGNWKQVLVKMAGDSTSCLRNEVQIKNRYN